MPSAQSSGGNLNDLNDGRDHLISLYNQGSDQIT